MTLQQERDQLFIDICNGKKPARVPILAPISVEAALEMKGCSIKRDLYSPEKCYEAADEMAGLFDSDTLPTIPFTQAAVYRYIDSKFMRPGADGFFQHPDIAPMKEDEYPEFIKDPFEFIVKKIQPRVFGILQDDPVLGQIRLKSAREVVASKFAGMTPKLVEKHQRASALTLCNRLWAPFDFIADYIRSFSTIVLDIKRNPQWILEACEAVLQYEIQQIKLTPKRGLIPSIAFPLHMPPFIRPKEVEKFWWPTFRKLMIATQEAGFIPNFYCEQNWDAHLDLLNDIPGKAIIGFESSNQTLIAEKVATRFVWRSVYPAEILKTGTQEQCVEEAKRVIDNLAGAGNFIFGVNKIALRGSDFKRENLQAVIEFVKEYGKF